LKYNLRRKPAKAPKLAETIINANDTQKAFVTEYIPWSFSPGVGKYFLFSLSAFFQK